MDGPPRICRLSVSVKTLTFQCRSLSKLSQGGSQPYGTMRSVTSSHLYLMTFVMMCGLNLTSTTMIYRTANTDTETRLDISACGFWGLHFEKAFMDVHIINPNAESYRNHSLETCFKRHEQEKSIYDQRIRERKHASFSPFVFSTSGGMASQHQCLQETCSPALVEDR